MQKRNIFAFSGHLAYIKVNPSLKKAWYVWTEYETEFFIKFIKDKSITGILDSKQKRNATINQDLETDWRVYKGLSLTLMLG